MAKDMMSMTPEERAKYHNEQRQRESAPSPEQMKQMRETAEQERMRRAGDTAPTTKTEMGKRYAAGGHVRGDGIAQRGRTKGRMV